MRQNRSLFLWQVCLLSLLLLTLFSQDALAQGGGQKPLNFEAATLVKLTDGTALTSATPGSLEQLYQAGKIGTGENLSNAYDIPLKPVFNFQFDKNVVNILIPWTNNITCFTLTANNTTIPISVMKIDDTVDFSRRQNIFVEPVNSLKPGTGYKLTVSANLKAKNGVNLNQAVTISFKTEGTAVQPPPSAPANPTPAPGHQSSAGNTASAGKSTPAVKQVQPSSTAKEPSTASAGNAARVAGTTAPSVATSTPATLSGEALATAQTVSTADKGATSPADWIVRIGSGLLICWLALEIILRLKRKP